MLGIFLIVQAHIKKALGPALLREVQATGLELEGPDPDRKQKAEPIVWLKGHPNSLERARV
jgi:hypothetical protein